MNSVAVEKCSSYSPATVRESLRRLLQPLGGMERFVKPGERVLLKPNLLAGKAPEKAVTTHPEVLRGVVELVREAGGVPLVGDSPGIGSTAGVARSCGILQVVQETGAELVDFGEAVEVSAAGTFKRLQLARPYVEADRIINLPKLKTHEMMTLTCAVKNLFGAVVGTEKAAWHLKAGADRELFARMLLEIALYRPPDLSIVDAVLCMEGNGPGSGTPKQMGLLLAGEDPVAVDMVAAEIAGIPRRLLFVQREGEKMGLSGAERKNIMLHGVPPEEVKETFLLPHLSDVQFGLPRFLKDALRQYMTARPVPAAEGCRLCGICRDACPPRAITIEGGKLIFDYRSCIRCFCCRELCPDGSLEVRDGFLLKTIKKFK